MILVTTGAWSGWETVAHFFPIQVWYSTSVMSVLQAQCATRRYGSITNGQMVPVQTMIRISHFQRCYSAINQHQCQIMLLVFNPQEQHIRWTVLPHFHSKPSLVKEVVMLSDLQVQRIKWKHLSIYPLLPPLLCTQSHCQLVWCLMVTQKIQSYMWV